VRTEFICHVEKSRQPLWSSSQSSWLQNQRSGSDSRYYQVWVWNGSTQPREYNWGAAWRKSSGSSLENREFGHGDTLRWPRNTVYPQKLALTSPTRGSQSVGIVRSRTQATEFVCLFVCCLKVTTHPHLVLSLRMVELYLHTPICHDIVLLKSSRPVL
jgi:hypothetical protein